MFKATFGFLHPPICGNSQIKAKDKGFIKFPILQHPDGIKMENVECLWDLEIQAKKEMILSVSIIQISIFIV